MKITLTLDIDGNKVSRDFELDDIEIHNWQNEVEDIKETLICEHNWKNFHIDAQYGVMEARDCQECLQRQFKVNGTWYDEEDAMFRRREEAGMLGIDTYPSDNYNQNPVKQ